MKNFLILLFVGSCLVILSCCEKDEGNVEISDKKEGNQETSGTELSGEDSNDLGEKDDDDDEIASVQPEQQMERGCKCENLTCECCIDNPLLGEACVDVKALKEEKSVKASLVWKGKEVKSIEKKLDDPMKFCVKIESSEACVIIKDISLDAEKFGGCISLTVKGIIFSKKIDYNEEIGCFHTKIKEALTQRDDDVPIRLRHGRWLPKKQRISKPQ